MSLGNHLLSSDWIFDIYDRLNHVPYMMFMKSEIIYHYCQVKLRNVMVQVYSDDI